MDIPYCAESIPVAAGAARWKRLAHWIARVTVVLLTMEFVARVDDKINHGAPIFDNYTFDQLFEYDGSVVRGTPNARYMKWSLNNIGLRGPDIDLSQQRTRVIVYGASEVFGIYETPGKDFPRQLEAELRARTKSDDIEVLNAGIPGMRIGSGSNFLSDLSERVKPSVVVLYPTPTHYLNAKQPYCDRPGGSPSPTVGKAKSQSSRLKKKVVERLKQTLPPQALHGARRFSIWVTTLSQDTVETINPVSLLAMERDLRCAVKAVRAAGAEPLLVTHTNRFGDDATADDKYHLAGWRKLYPSFAERLLLEIDHRANEIIKEVAILERVPLVDADERMSGKKEYFADHAHFNESALQNSARAGIKR